MRRDERYKQIPVQMTEGNFNEFVLSMSSESVPPHIPQ